MIFYYSILLIYIKFPEKISINDNFKVYDDYDTKFNINNIFIKF